MSHVQLTDGRMVRLGRKRPAARPLVPRFAAYFNPATMKSTPPVSVDYATKALPALKRMYLNDQYGDCVIAGKYHQVGVWSGNDTAAPIQGTDAEVLAAYHQICGPGDEGCVITDVLDVFVSRGLLLNGTLHKIDGYVAVDWTNPLEVQVAIDVFGSLTLGINLPSAWTCTNCTWEVTSSGIVGGHDVCCVGYNQAGVQIATWGGIVTITWAAFTSKRWIEEAYAQLSPDWYGSDKLAPNGIDAATLKDDLAKLGQGTIPPIDPVPPGPAPTPPPPGPTPVPFTLSIPRQAVHGTRIGGLYVDAFTVNGMVNVPPRTVAALPPWVSPLLAALCAAAPSLPPPYGPLLQLACAFVNPHAKAPCGCQG